MLRKLSLVLAAMLIVLVARAAPPLAVPAAAVTAAGEQRMLSQRLAKAYVQVGLDVAPDLAVEQFRDAVGRFERNLDHLRPVVADISAAAPAFQHLEQRWTALRSATGAPVAPESAAIVSRRSLEVLESADRLAAVLESATGGVAGPRIARAGRLPMLSQRLVKAYLLYSWGVEAHASQGEMEAAAREFGNDLAAIAALPDNTPAARAELDEIMLQWEWLRAALAVEGAVSYRLVVAEAADSILMAADRLVRLYEQPTGR